MNTVTPAAVRCAREAAGVSQTSLAEGMRLHGFKWHQVTVGRVEQGERPLRWDEGVALRDLIGFGVETSEQSLVHDALAYRRILSVIRDIEAAAVGTVDGLADVRRYFDLNADRPVSSDGYDRDNPISADAEAVRS